MGRAIRGLMLLVRVRLRGTDDVLRRLLYILYVSCASAPGQKVPYLRPCRSTVRVTVPTDIFWDEKKTNVP